MCVSFVLLASKCLPVHELLFFFFFNCCILPLPLLLMSLFFFIKEFLRLSVCLCVRVRELERERVILGINVNKIMCVCERERGKDDSIIFNIITPFFYLFKIRRETQNYLISASICFSLSLSGEITSIYVEKTLVCDVLGQCRVSSQMASSKWPRSSSSSSSSLMMMRATSHQAY